MVHGSKAKTAGIVGVATLLAGGVAGVSVPPSSAVAGDVLLTAEQEDLGDGVALIMGPGGWPVPGDAYMSSVDQMYLEPNGFTGETVAVTYPWSNLLLGWDDRVSSETDSLVDAIEAQWDEGDFSAANPLVIVGYSESAVAAGQAMQQLWNDGIHAPHALNFILLGDTASAQGGFLSTFLPSLPDWLREPVKELLAWSGLSDLLGATTPTDLYETDVYTITGDPWSDWPEDLTWNPSLFWTTLTGMFSTHLEYLGLTPDQIGAAALSDTEGLTDYYTIPGDDINVLEALCNAAVSMGAIPDWLASIFS